MTVTVIVGAQWGDEGKGHIVDFLASRSDIVARFQGGDNAGHTIVNEYGKFALHLVPSGIFVPHVYCLLGAGTVVNLDALGRELDALHRAGIDTGNLHIDRRAHLVWPFHLLLDGAAEERGTSLLGTTRRGIGPVHGDKYSYAGTRVGDLCHMDMLEQRLEAILPLKNHQLAFYGLQQFTVTELMQLAATWRERFGHLIVDSVPVIRTAVRQGRNVLLEGQLGIGRCIDWGIYPYSTASSPTAGGACVGAGIPPRSIDEVLGVVKAYSTSVGEGPFPTELHDEQGAALRQIGQEYGATTGRPRRCGWFDGVQIRYASWINGFTGLAITKLDVLDQFETIAICVGYRLGGEVVQEVPDTTDQGQAEALYETMPGWREDTTSCRSWKQLPKQARAYLERISELAETPIRFVSVGPERAQIITL